MRRRIATLMVTMEGNIQAQVLCQVFVFAVAHHSNIIACPQTLVLVKGLEPARLTDEI